jgi:alcohol dehydrogenase YqhD (iron-dependent ADH family)
MKKFANFTFNMYTENVFGRGTEAQTGKLIRKYGGTKVMIVYGAGSVKKSGLYDRVVKTLNDEKLPYVEFGGVKPNPLRSHTEKGLALALAEKVDFVLGLGGGSAIDTGKGIALGLANGGEFWKFYDGTPAKKMAPVGAVLTLSATGTENSNSTVLVDDVKTGEKRGIGWDPCRPVFAIMNPELTYSVSAWQTGAGCADIFSHTFMRYFMKGAAFLTDEFAEAVLKTVVKYAAVAIAEPDNYEARAELMQAGAFAHNGLTGMGRTGPMAGEHPLEHQLSGHYDTTHGAGLSVIMPALLAYFVNHGGAEQAARAAQFAVKVFGASPDLGDLKATAFEGIRRFKSWLKSIGMPLTLKELGVPKKDLDAVIKRCLEANGGLVKGYMDLDEKAVTEIYSSALE